jgi:ABC-2 type transport system permease protein
MSQFVTGIRAHTLQFLRKPQNLVFLVVIPPIATVMYGRAVERVSSLTVAYTSANLGAVGRLTGALWATAFLVGIIGLFQVISARRGDERLVLCGFSRSMLLATRCMVVFGVAVLVAVISGAVLWATVPVSAPLVAVGVLLLGGMMYGLIGMLVGALLPRELEGALVMALIVDIDDMVSSGLFFDPTSTVVTQLFPLYRPQTLLVAAVTGGSLPVDHAIGAGIYVLVLAALTFVVYGRLIDSGGGDA